MSKNINFNIKLSDLKQVHLIGIGGISMSAIAHILIKRGIHVSGSDIHDSAIIQDLRNAGAEIIIGHNSDIIDSQDLIIYTGAVHDDNPEIRMAREKEIPILKRTQVIDIFMKEHSISIAVAGTHGKSTTTTMTTMLLDELGKNPSFMIGANVPVFSDTHRLNNSDFIAVEACEYQGAFLDFNPTTLIVTNIEYEHVDFFKSLEHVIETFKEFADKLPHDGILIYNADDENSVLASRGVECNKYSYGIDNPADYNAVNLKKDVSGKYSFDVLYHGEKLMSIALNVIGKFNVYNTLASIAGVHANGIGLCQDLVCFSKFENASRRFEVLKKVGDCLIVSDYAHHHTEIMATLSAAAEMDYENTIVFFQPHTYSRTHKFMNNLSQAFKNTDLCYIADIYPAREENIYKVSSQQLCEEIAKNDVKCEYIGSHKNIEVYLKKHLDKKNLIIFMGAGDMDFTVREVLEKL